MQRVKIEMKMQMQMETEMEMENDSWFASARLATPRRPHNRAVPASSPLARHLLNSPMQF